MALIGKIRSNLWIVVVLIGLAMAGFLLMDMGSGPGGGGIFGGSPTTAGTINGMKVDVKDLDARTNFRNNPNVDNYTLRNSVWNEMVNEAIISNEAEKLGLTVSDVEMESLLFDMQHMSPVIRRDFSNPQTRQVDMEQLLQIRDLETAGTLNPQFVPQWEEEKRSVRQTRLQEKLTNAISKSIYTPKWMAEMQHNDLNAKAQVAYVRIPFDRIDNTEVALEDADYKNYLEANRNKYLLEDDTRTIEYVAFNVMPTMQDSAAIKLDMAEKSLPKLKDFPSKKSGEVVSDAKYFLKDELPPVVADSLFGKPVGSIHGPYLDARDNTFKYAKLVDKLVVPDSVSARHILRPIDVRDPNKTFQAASDTIRLIKELLEKGEITFDSLAAKYGTDGTASNGGDLGTFTYQSMVTPFANYCFFEGKEGEYGVVKSQFGLHLVLVEKKYRKSGKEGVKVAYVSRDIKPSDKTTTEKYKEASKFALSNPNIAAFRKSAKDANLDIVTSSPVDENGFFIKDLMAGEVTRNIIKWAFTEANTEDVSPTVYQYTDPRLGYKNKYVVAALAAKNKKGMPSVESMKSTIGTIVMNEKKGEKLAAQVKGKDLATIAAEFDEVAVDTVSAAFGDASIDPKLIAAAINLEAGQKTEPVVGRTGVFVGQMITPPANTPAPSNLASLQKRIASPWQNAANRSLLPALRKEADIDDKRSKFY